MDVGELKIPTILENWGEFAGSTELYNLYGETIPAWARVRLAITYLRGYDMPVVAKIPEIGRLLYYKEGWEVV